MEALQGRKQVVNNVERAVAEFTRRAKKALRKIGREVRERGMRITPVDTGNLVGSWYGPVIISESPLLVEIGLTANYAPYVHEMVEANFREPGATAKFLENPLKEVEGEMRAKLWRILKGRIDMEAQSMKEMRSMWE